MTKVMINFDSWKLAKTAKMERLGESRAIHNDIIDGKIRVTFVNGDDDPNNSPEAQNRRIVFERKKELSTKLEDDSITFDELKEYLRLK